MNPPQSFQSLHEEAEWLVQRYFPRLGTELVNLFLQEGKLVSVESQSTLIREGQYIKVIPVVLRGLVKVFIASETKELLLYYIEAKESCIMSFAAGLHNDPSRINAITEEDSLLLLLPTEKVKEWTEIYPAFNKLFMELFDQRYQDLLQNIQLVLFHNLDERLLHYLQERGRHTHKPVVELSHRRIAQDLGTAREVITRTMQRLENEGKIRQKDNGIELV
ncbi:MAG TPA: Crp/Fnr family transcriptional regulator [Saprospiraceae bacterium]|nr:Crp/Fnr family transcriptional regulator [Saprospiraceae bacterium]